VPSMTEAQMRGVSTAAEPTPAMVDRLLSAIDRFAAGNTQFGATDIGRTPSTEQSFGSIRAYAISLAQHDTVLAQQAAAQYGVPFDYSAALQKATSRRFAEIGVDPANPARNLGGPVARPAMTVVVPVAHKASTVLALCRTRPAPLCPWGAQGHI